MMSAAMTEDISKMWRIFPVGLDCVLELRCLSPVGAPEKLPALTLHHRAQCYDDLDALKRAFEQDALAKNNAGYNVYVNLNPIKPEFAGHACTDNDIQCRDLLLVDIDRQGTKKCPADQLELDAADHLANEITTFLSTCSFGNPLKVMSGNGYHLYYVLKQLPNTLQTTAEIQKLLHLLAFQFNNSTVSVDTTVANASRITKIPGTVMRKGEETPDRPYRRAYVCDE